MGVRNSKELGDNLFLLANKLLDKPRLRQLLVNSGINPFDTPVEDKLALLHKNVLIVPKVDEEDFDKQGKVCIIMPSAIQDDDNDEFKNLTLQIQVYTPLETWIINDMSLRPFLIMSEIEEALKGKRINGIGVITYIGFDLKLLTDKLSCYQMEFEIDVFN